MDITYSKEDYDAFKRLYIATGSYDQTKRINACMVMAAFIKGHGRDKCDAMFDKLMADPEYDEGEAA